jgi:hypothetical protein
MTISLPRPLVGVLALVFASALTGAFTISTVDVAVAAHVTRATARPKTCDISGVSDRLGPTSVTSLTVLHVRCDRGISVVRAFQSCRLAHGTSGRCVRLVKGYACSERRTSTPTQFSATATCVKGRASVVHRYTQVTS